MDTSFQLDMPQDDNEYGNDDAGGGAANDIGNLDSRYGGRRDEEDDDGGMDYELDNDQRGFRVSSIRPIHPNTLPTTTTATSKRTTRTRTKKLLKISPHTSLPISTFPHRITKKLATTFSNGMGGTLGKETLAMIQEAGERFLENLSTDCADYAAHGKRGGRIEEGDVLMLFKRYVGVVVVISPNFPIESAIPDNGIIYRSKKFFFIAYYTYIDD